MPQPGLAGGVGEQRGVEQRDERHLERGGRAVGVGAQDGVEDLGGIGGPSPGSATSLTDELAEPVDERPGDGDTHAHPVTVGHIAQRLVDLVADMPGDAIRRLGAAQRLGVDELLGEVVERRPQPLGDELLVQPGRRLRHGQRVGARRDRVGDLDLDLAAALRSPLATQHTLRGPRHS